MSLTNIDKFSNGIGFIHKKVASPVSHCCIMLDIGSRDESEEEEGIAHFWEHMAFKGTEKRKSFQIINCLDNVGGELNAYTTKEKICFYATVLNEHFPKAVELLTDIVFNSIFPDKELEKERGVILEEMLMYKDSPDDAIQDDFDLQIFPNHELGHNIIGNEKTINQFKREDFFRFLHKHIDTNRIVFASVGGLKTEKVKLLAQKYLEGIPTRNSISIRKPFSTYQPKHINVETPFKQVHCAIGTTAYSSSQPERIPFFLLCNMLGGQAMNSKLNVELREKRGLVYHVEASFHPFVDSGLFAIYFGTDLKKLEKCRDLVYKQINSICKGELTTSTLSVFKKQLMGQMAIGEERNNSVMLSMARSFLDLGKVDTFDEIKAQIAQVKLEEVVHVANQTINVDRLSSLSFIPNRNS